MSIVLAVLSLLTAAPRSNAQSSACGASTGLTLSAGVGQNDRVDATASPFQFRGRGLQLAAALVRAHGRFCLTVDGEGGAKLLASRQGTSATERLIEGDGGVGVLHTTSMRSLSLGVEARGLLAVTDHTYGDPRHIVATYRIGALSLGPALRWERPLFRGHAVVQLSSPLIALVDHPYVAVWTTDPEPSFRLASLTQFRAGHAALSYEWSAWHGVASVASYRLTAVRYDDVHPLRSLSQDIVFGVRVPFVP
ncbi:MAG TPA: hypothetical protein VHB25_01600 [Gemmatimonadaceae bacterium]|nr:hypothetical protein [Gemmatimonadaceae bacterium]